MTANALRCGLLLALLLIVGLIRGADASGQAVEASLYVSVIDASGQAVTGLTASDFAIREDGTDREILRATAATEPLRVALLADTSSAADAYVQEMRAGLLTFVRAVLEKNPDAQIGLWEFGQAAVRLHPFSSDITSLSKPAGRLYPKGRAASVLLEALYDTSEALDNRPSPRRAIVVLNVEPADEQSQQEPQRLNDSLRRSRAQLWALSVQRGSLRNAPRDVLLNTLARNAGGRREFIVAPTAIASYMRQYADALTSQYQITYRRPAGPVQIVQTGVRREGARVIAGIFPQR